jgi:hypothetical protein
VLERAAGLLQSRTFLMRPLAVMAGEMGGAKMRSATRDAYLRFLQRSADACAADAAFRQSVLESNLDASKDRTASAAESAAATSRHDGMPGEGRTHCWPTSQSLATAVRKSAALWAPSSKRWPSRSFRFAIGLPAARGLADDRVSRP